MDDRDTGNAVLANLCALNMWANLTLVDACAELELSSPGATRTSSTRTLRLALWGLMEREHQFVAALNGEPDSEQRGLPGRPDGSLGTLRVHAIDSGEALTAWAEEVTGDPMLHREWAGQSLQVPASILIGEALLQAAVQRSLIQGMLERLGFDAPDLTALAWWGTLQRSGPESATI